MVNLRWFDPPRCDLGNFAHGFHKLVGNIFPLHVFLPTLGSRESTHSEVLSRHSFFALHQS
jgi:hypothetical protein